MDWYTKLNKALESYENHKSWHDKSIEWICDRIDWCYKWKKITEDQMEELTKRVIQVIKGL